MNDLFRAAIAAVCVLAGGLVGPLHAGERTRPLDCLPDRVVIWQAAEPTPEARFGAANLPGIVLGVVGGSLPTLGATSVASLGNGGTTTIEFVDLVIEDRPGPDFIVFENPFFVGAPPAAETDNYTIFAEPAIVEVSADGESWVAFPYDVAALAEATGANIDRDLHLRLRGLAGITPTFSGNWTEPDDPDSWDPSGVGGVSGAGGDAFDLADVGLAEIRYVRLTDSGSGNGAPGSAEGFDFDTIVALHAKPRFLPSLIDRTGTDSDGDGLSDLAETTLFGSDPANPDTDLDGIDDGREVAGCHDPNSSAVDVWHRLRAGLWLVREETDEVTLRWNYPGDGVAVDLIRGRLEELSESTLGVDLGVPLCLASAVAGVRFTGDAELPLPGLGFWYLVQSAPNNDYGHASSWNPRETVTGCP